MSLQFPVQGMNQQGRHVGDGAGVIPSGCCDLTGSFSSLEAERAETELWGVLALLFYSLKEFFFPFFKSLLQSLPKMPNLCSHFQILPDTVETFLV